MNYQNESADSLREMVSSLESQLVSLYEEKQRVGDVEHMPDMIQSLEAQRVSLYHEKQAMPLEADGVVESISSLEAQVISLTDEKMELEAKLHAIQADLREKKQKTRVIGAAIMEAALFSEEKEGSN